MPVFPKIFLVESARFPFLRRSAPPPPIEISHPEEALQVWLPNEARALVDGLVERRVPLVWHGDDVKRVLDPTMVLQEQVLLLLASTSGKVSILDLLKWTDSKNKAYFLKLLRRLHKNRLIELAQDKKAIQLLPPGSQAIERLLADRTKL